MDDQYILRNYALLLLILLLGSACGSSRLAEPAELGGPAVESEPSDLELFGDGSLDGSEDGSRSVSAVYQKYFADSVNAQSTGRWQIFNEEGDKSWFLSNTSFSAPKAWLIGGNYWGPQWDYLRTKTFTIPAGNDTVKLTFRSRHKLGLTGVCDVNVNVDGFPIQITQFIETENASYPGWDRYTFKIPQGFNGQWAQDRPAYVEFLFRASSGLDWGFGVDNVAVYRTAIGAPANLSASDATSRDNIDITWDHPASSPQPTSYLVSRSRLDGSQPVLLASVPYPGHSYTDTSAGADARQGGLANDAAQFIYKVESVRSGYQSGFASDTGAVSNGSWQTVEIGPGSAGVLTTYAAFVNMYEIVQDFDGGPRLDFTGAQFNYGALPANWGGTTTLDTIAPAGLVASGPNYVYPYDDGNSRGIVIGSVGDPSTTFTTPAPVDHIAGFFDGNDGYMHLLFGSEGQVRFVRSLSGATFPASGSTLVATGTPISLIDQGDTVACFYADGSGLWFTRALTPLGQVWSTPTRVTYGGEAFGGLLVEGRPAATFRNGLSLYYRRALNAAGTSWAAPVLIANRVWSYDVAEVNDVPAVAYRTQETEWLDEEMDFFDVHTDLNYTEAYDSDGAKWYPAVRVARETYGDMDGIYTYESITGIDLQEFNNVPAISYIFSSTPGTLDDQNNIRYSVRVP